MTKIRSITKLYKSVLYSIYFILLYEYSKRFVHPVVQLVVRPVVQPAAKCERTLKLTVLSGAERFIGSFDKHFQQTVTDRLQSTLIAAAGNLIQIF